MKRLLILVLLAFSAMAADQNFRYYRLSTTAPGYAATLATLAAAHKKTWPANKLSVVTNDAGSEVLVKVDWGKEIPVAVSPTIKISEDTAATHPLVIETLKGVAWSKTRGTNTVVKAVEPAVK